MLYNSANIEIEIKFAMTYSDTSKKREVQRMKDLSEEMIERISKILPEDGELNAEPYLILKWAIEPG